MPDPQLGGGGQGVAELANALVLGTRNCGFKSRHPDPPSVTRCGSVLIKIMLEAKVVYGIDLT